MAIPFSARLLHAVPCDCTCELRLNQPKLNPSQDLAGLLTTGFSYKVSSRKSGILCCRLEWWAPDYRSSVLAVSLEVSGFKVAVRSGKPDSLNTTYKMTPFIINVVSSFSLYIRTQLPFGSSLNRFIEHSFALFKLYKNSVFKTYKPFFIKNSHR